MWEKGRPLFPGVPPLANMVEGGKTPILPAARLQELGFRLAIYPNALTRLFAKAGTEMLASLKQHGTTSHFADRMFGHDELGFPRLAIDNWYGISGPPGMPAPIVTKIAEALNTALRDPAFGERLRGLGLEPKIMNGAEFRTFIADMFTLWKDTVRTAGVQAD